MSALFFSFPRHAAPAMIAAATAGGAGRHHVPLLRLLHQGRMTLHLMQRGCRRFALPRASAISLPALVVVGDDDARSLGPNAFPAAAEVFRWAAAAAFNAAGAHPADYEAAGELALRWRAAVMVETTPAHLGAWHSLASAHQNPPGLPLGFTVLPGGAKPQAQETRH